MTIAGHQQAMSEAGSMQAKLHMPQDLHLPGRVGLGRSGCGRASHTHLGDLPRHGREHASRDGTTAGGCAGPVRDHGLPQLHVTAVHPNVQHPRTCWSCHDISNGAAVQSSPHMSAPGIRRRCLALVIYVSDRCSTDKKSSPVMIQYDQRLATASPGTM